MELKARTRMPFPRELVYRTIRDRLPELAPYMPNVKEIQMKERVEDGPRVRFLNIWFGKTEIPAIAQRYVKPELFQWTDKAVWDESDFSCEWAIETHAWPGVVVCSGRNVYVTIGNETELQINGTLTLNLDKAPIPRLFVGTVRPIVEKLIVAGLTPNLTSIGDAVGGFLKAQK